MVAYLPGERAPPWVEGNFRRDLAPHSRLLGAPPRREVFERVQIRPVTVGW